MNLKIWKIFLVAISATILPFALIGVRQGEK
jgi:hypothetical protein